MALQEHHDVADLALRLPGACDHGDALGADARHLAPAGRRRFSMTSSVSLAEALDDALGHDRPQPLDQPGAQVFHDPVDRRRHLGGELLDLELLAELAGGWSTPPPCPAPRPGSGASSVADHRDRARRGRGPSPWRW
ncbi:MAG: hypothetical protein MZU91_07200 [Desulfosudis oleivorans]|nr:hypothetical protein [Desulfosudis oleivorans]